RINSSKRGVGFNPNTFLSTIGKGRDFLSFKGKETVFAQGDPTDGLFFIRKGKIQLSVVSEAGKEATLGIIRVGDFFEISAEAKHPVSGRFDRPTVQLQREEAGTESFAHGALRERRCFRNVHSTIESGNSGGDGGNDSFASEFLHEPIQAP